MYKVLNLNVLWNSYFCRVKTGIFQKFMVSVLALLVLVITNSFAIEKHFCGDNLITSSVFAELQKCSGCIDPGNESSIIDHCCKDVVDVQEGKEATTVKKFDDLEKKQQVFLITFSNAFFSVFQPDSILLQDFRHYDAPLITKDSRLYYQVFLI